MALGTLAAVIHGTALPLLMLVFGHMTDSFTKAETSVPSNITNQSKDYLWYRRYQNFANNIHLTYHLQGCVLCRERWRVGAPALACNEFEKIMLMGSRTPRTSVGRDV